MSDRLAQLPSLHLKGGLGSVGGDDGALLERSGISGRSNPLAAPVQWVLSADRATGWAVYSPAYEGPAGHVHGGFVAAAFDDLLGSAQTLSGIAGYTGTLTVKMLRPTPLERRIDYEAGVTRGRGSEDLRVGHRDVRGHAARGGGHPVHRTPGRRSAPLSGLLARQVDVGQLRERDVRQVADDALPGREPEAGDRLDERGVRRTRPSRSSPLATFW